MKCKCGAEMKLWQAALVEGVPVNKYRCEVCGREKAELPEAKPPKKLEERK